MCGGRGQIETGTAPAPGHGGKPSGDDIEGRWLAAGTWYEFTKNGDQYVVVEGGPAGETGRGTATREGNTLRLDVKGMIGTYTLDLTLEQGSLHGRLLLFGQARELRLTRG